MRWRNKGIEDKGGHGLLNLTVEVLGGNHHLIPITSTSYMKAREREGDAGVGGNVCRSPETGQPETSKLHQQRHQGSVRLEGANYCNA